MAFTPVLNVMVQGKVLNELCPISQIITDAGRSAEYHGEITTNYYGKAVPKHAHGTSNSDNPFED